MKTSMKKPVVWGGVAICLISTAVPALAVPTLCNHRVLARFDNSPDDPANKAILNQYGASVHWRAFMLSGLVSIKCPQGNATLVAAALSTSPNVKYAETFTSDPAPWSVSCQGHAGDPNQLTTLTASNIYAHQWARNNIGQPIAGVVGISGRDMKLAQAHQVTTGESGVVVAVIDSAISIDHPALVNSLWTNSNEIAGDNIDNDANGIVDDIHGVKFGELPSEEPYNSGDPRPPSDATSSDFNHGTSTAGLIFAAPSSGLSGVAPGCRLMSLSILQSGRLFESDLYPERIVMAFDYAMYMKARVSSLSMSFADAMPTAFLELLEVAESIDHLFVAAAGNSYCNCDVPGAYRFPAAHSMEYPAIIGIAATDNNDCLAIYIDGLPQGCGGNKGSNFGPQSILLGAPGWRNVSLRMLPGPNSDLYTWFGGTSAAAPHVAGAVALLLSIHPEYTCADIKDKLVDSGRAVDSLDGITISGKTLDIGALIDP